MKRRWRLWVRCLVEAWVCAGLGMKRRRLRLWLRCIVEAGVIVQVWV